MDEEERIKVSDYRYVGLLAKHIIMPKQIMPYCPQQVSEAEAMFTFTIVITSLTHTGDTVSDSSIGLTAAMTHVLFQSHVCYNYKLVTVIG